VLTATRTIYHQTGENGKPLETSNGFKDIFNKGSVILYLCNIMDNDDFYFLDSPLLNILLLTERSERVKRRASRDTYG
jgi:hypothetical protein